MSRAQAFQKRRWICLAAALVICVCAGFGYAWSVLQNPIVAAHGWPEGQVSLAYTVTVVCSTMAPLFFGGLIRRISTRMCIALGAVLFGGGLFLGAIFMATDYTTSPVTKKGQVIFGIGCGLFTILIRYFGSYNEGVCYSIMVMNLLAPLIDKYTKPTRFGVVKSDKKEAAAK